MERHWTIDLSGMDIRRAWASTGLGLLGVAITAKYAPEMLPVAILVVPIAYLIHHDESDHKPLWKFRKDRV